MKSENVWPPALFFLKIVLGVWDSLRYHTYFMIFFFFLQKNAIEILIRIVLNLYLALSNMDILTILSLPVNMGFLSIYLYLLSFLSSLFCSFQCMSLLPSWLNLFQGILSFWCFHFLNFLFWFSLLVHRNATDFWVLVYILQLCWISLVILTVSYL